MDHKTRRNISGHFSSTVMLYFMLTTVAVISADAASWEESTPASTSTLSCTRTPIFSDFVEQIAAGHMWAERCRLCRCDGETGNIDCVLTKGAVCDQPYDPSVDRMCLQWSEDGCCCLATGCRVQGTDYRIGEFYQVDKTNPCSEKCKCVAVGHRTCFNTPCFLHRVRENINN